MGTVDGEGMQAIFCIARSCPFWRSPVLKRIRRGVLVRTKEAFRKLLRCSSVSPVFDRVSGEPT